MSHSFFKIWVHAIWATKDRSPLIHDSLEKRLYSFLKDQFLEQDCPVRIINGMPDHVHCLFLLNPQKPLVEIIKQVKGSSSFFVNKNNLTKDKFSWQTGYAAFSVSESALEKAYLYIKNQKQHHLKKTFQQENDQFIKLYGLDKQS